MLLQLKECFCGIIGTPRKENFMGKRGASLVSVHIFVGAALIASSCAKPYHEETERYVFVATNINLPYWREAQAGFLGAAKALGVKGKLVGPTAFRHQERVGVLVLRFCRVEDWRQAP